MATKTVSPGQGVPGFVSGDVIHFKTGTHRPSDVIRVPMPNVTFEFEAGVVLDGRRVLGNIFYGNGGDDTKLIALAQESPPRMINALKTAIYMSQADHFLFRCIYTGFSGSDEGSNYLDHGIYIDGCVGFVVEGHISEKMTAHGIQLYSGSLRTTTGIIDGFRSFANRGDGMHFGAASKDCVLTDYDGHDNLQSGIHSYGGTGNKVKGPNNYIYRNKGGAVQQDKPLALLEFKASPPPTEPPPIPTPEPEPPKPSTDPCQDVKDALSVMTAKANTYAQKLELANDRLDSIDELAVRVA